MVPGQHPRSWLPATGVPPLSTSHHHIHPVFTTPPFSTPVLPVPVHKLSKIFSAVNLQSTGEDESASKLHLHSPLKFRLQPGPCKKEVAETQ